MLNRFPHLRPEGATVVLSEVAEAIDAVERRRDRVATSDTSSDVGAGARTDRAKETKKLLSVGCSVLAA